MKRTQPYMKHPHRRPFACAFILFIFAYTLASAEPPKSSLIDNSPFLPPGYGVKPEPKAPPPVAPKPTGQLSREIEFRGVFQMGDAEPKFNLFDKRQQKGSWLKMSEATDRYELVDYDQASGTVKLKSGGQIEEIKMAKANDSPLAVQNFQNNNRNNNNANVNNRNNNAQNRTNTFRNNSNRAQVNASSNTTKKRRVIPRRRIIRRRTANNETGASAAPAGLPSTPPPPPPPPLP